MNWVRPGDADYEARLHLAAGGSSLFDPVVEDRARAILERVRTEGDAALQALTLQFDKADLEPHRMELTTADQMAAALAAGPELREAVQQAHTNIAAFAKRSRRRNWEMVNRHGALVGEKFDPFQRVGVYIPGGTAPLVSTALMTLTLAQVAGCPEIIVCTPPGPDGTVNPALIHAATRAGATRIFRVGGAQAIAAMAYGTDTVPSVQKIFGPGNAYVVAAKRLLFGVVAVDLLPGPSEVCVLADETARADDVAADLLAQAEHGSGHERVWVVSNAIGLLEGVEQAVRDQLPTLARREFIEKVLHQNAWLIQVPDLHAGVELVNRLAPEHCEIMTRQPRRWSEGIRTAGALFLGRYSPTVLGDYVAGPSHTLPTGGAGRSFAGLTVDQFQRRTSLVEYSSASLRKALGAVQVFAQLEGLDAHGRSAEIRLVKSRTNANSAAKGSGKQTGKRPGTTGAKAGAKTGAKKRSTA